jgi:hypothetical protein
MIRNFGSFSRAFIFVILITFSTYLFILLFCFSFVEEVSVEKGTVTVGGMAGVDKIGWLLLCSLLATITKEGIRAPSLNSQVNC